MKSTSLIVLILTLASCHATGGPQEPQPRAVDPGGPGKPPSDAIVLFDGKNLSEWVYKDGRPAAWPVIDGAVVSKSGTGDIHTRRKIGSAQIHVEFAIPLMPRARDQARGNSGVYLQGRYEIQVLDSYHNPTYPNGSGGALYGQYAPLVNASRPPEQWQTYDIIFHAPRCGAGGAVTHPATLTLLQNGVLVQDDVAVKGPTGGGARDNPCEPGPLMLQDHHHPDVKETFMRFRNIWFRSLEEKR